MSSLFHRISRQLACEAATQRQVLPWILLGITLLNLPNLLAAFVPMASTHHLWLLAHSIAFLVLVGVFGLSMRLWLLVLTPLLLLVPATSGYLLATHTLPSTFTFLALMETNHEELSVFRNQGLLSLGVAALLIASYLFIVLRKVPRNFKLGLTARGVVALTLLMPAASDVFSYGFKSLPYCELMRLTAAFPMGTFYSANEALSLRREVTDRSRLMSSLRLQQDPAASGTNERQVNFLVIGESARYDSFQINGYPRPTTPGLSKTEGLLSFKDVSATAPMTLAAVPQLLTHATPGDVRAATHLPSLMHAYRRAGYKVYWLSAQPKHGVFDTMTSIYSNDADEAVYLGNSFDSVGSGAGGKAQDWQLLPLMKKFLDRHDQRVLFVLHTIGSHGPYYNRYPIEFDKFPVSEQAFRKAFTEHILQPSPSAESRRVLTDAYDNTICMTDFFLTNIIRTAQKENVSSWVYYISDHGENSGDAALASFAHGTFTKDVLHVPMVVWMSPAYRAGHASQVAALEKHISVSFSSSCTYHTVLDLGGLHTQDMVPAWSAASPDFKPGPRLVSTTRDEVVDYDKDVLPALAQRDGWHPMTPRKVITATAR